MIGWEAERKALLEDFDLDVELIRQRIPASENRDRNLNQARKLMKSVLRKLEEAVK